MRNRLYLMLTLLVATVFSGCNIYSWSYSEETSTDYPTIMAGAEYAFDLRDYDKAISLYDRALLADPGNGWPRHRKLQCLMLRHSGEDDSLFTTHRPLFLPEPHTGTNALFGTWKGTEAALFFDDSKSGYGIAIQLRTNLSYHWSSLGPDDPGVLGDHALVSALYALLILQDGNGNRIILEPSDPGRINTSFSYSLTNTLTGTEKTNMAYRLADATNIIRQSRSILEELFIAYPISGQSGSVWTNLYRNLEIASSNTASVIFSLGVLP